jgi:hypothetical protein
MHPNRDRGTLLLTVLVAGVIGAMGGGCRPKDELIEAPFTDAFERSEIGPGWTDTGANYRISGGRLNVSNAYNHPAWLRKRLPRDVVIELDALSKSPAGDLKVEIYGDGHSFDPDKGGYVSSGYDLIFGGWRNSLSVICRNNEHDEGRKVERRAPSVELGRSYHWTITRRGGAIDWQIDGKPFLAWTDPSPLAGDGHEYFAVNDWEADVYFDNLTIRPAPVPRPQPVP